jgi:methionine salvage enolase-phosphatase E1
MIQKIYPDTSIIGGYFDEEFAVETQALFERLGKGVKPFDCIKVKQAVQSLVAAETAGMSTGELLAYFNSPAGAGVSVPFSPSQPHHGELLQDASDGCGVVTVIS